MADIVSRYNSYLIVMHIKGTPENMQNNPSYDNLLSEIYSYLEGAINRAIEHEIARDRIIIDPGIGFGKTLEDNYTIIRNLGFFKRMGIPLLVGISRKSLIGRLYHQDENRLPATIALNALSILWGADIIRVHDVKEHRLALASLEMLKKVNYINGSCI